MSLSFFKPRHVYVKLSSNKIEVVNLSNGESASEIAMEAFSTPRIVIASFSKTYQVLASVFEQLNLNKRSFSSMKLLIQQMEKLEGGLSDIERRAMRDLGEQIGANYVIVIDHTNELTVEQALMELQLNKQ